MTWTSNGTSGKQLRCTDFLAVSWLLFWTPTAQHGSKLSAWEAVTCTRYQKPHKEGTSSYLPSISNHQTASAPRTLSPSSHLNLNSLPPVPLLSENLFQQPGRDIDSTTLPRLLSGNHLCCSYLACSFLKFISLSVSNHLVIDKSIDTARSTTCLIDFYFISSSDSSCWHYQTRLASVYSYGTLHLMRHSPSCRRIGSPT